MAFKTWRNQQGQVQDRDLPSIKAEVLRCWWIKKQNVANRSPWFLQKGWWPHRSPLRSQTKEVGSWNLLGDHQFLLVPTKVTPLLITNLRWQWTGSTTVWTGLRRERWVSVRHTQARQTPCLVGLCHMRVSLRSAALKPFSSFVWSS